MQYKTGCSDVQYIDEDLSDKEMAALFKASDILVHPYRAEGFGMHVQEAMACGCIPVVSDGGPTDDFVSHENGFRLPTERKSMNIADPNVFAMKSGDAMTGMSTHTFYNEPNVQALTNGIKMIYHSHNKEEEIYNKRNNMNMVNTWEKIAEDYGETYDLGFANGGDQNNDTIPERPVCDEMGIALIDGLGDKIQSSSWLLKKL